MYNHSGSPRFVIVLVLVLEKNNDELLASQRFQSFEHEHDYEPLLKSYVQ
jgi:hypothetical protein